MADNNVVMQGGIELVPGLFYGVYGIQTFNIGKILFLK